MNIAIERHGLTIDGTRYPCTVRQRMTGGNLRVDRQEERGEDEATSRVAWEYDGWEVRRLALTISASTATASGEGDVRPALSAHLHQASRSGPTPELHNLRGTMLRGAGATTTQWLMAGDPDWDDDGTTNELALTVEFDEFDPEIATLRRAPAPQPEAPEDDPEPADGLGDDARERAEELQQVLRDAQPLGPGF